MAASHVKSYAFCRKIFWTTSKTRDILMGLQKIWAIVKHEILLGTEREIWHNIHK